MTTVLTMGGICVTVVAHVLRYLPVLVVRVYTPQAEQYKFAQHEHDAL